MSSLPAICTLLLIPFLALSCQEIGKTSGPDVNPARIEESVSLSPLSERLPRPKLLRTPALLGTSHPTLKVTELLQEGPLDGITLGLYSQDPNFDYGSMLEEIHATGTPWVSLNVNYYQPKADSIRVAVPDARSARHEQIVRTIRQARRLGLRVMLFPILLLQDAASNDWRGTIAPTDRNEWFRGYLRHIVRLARLAQREGVEIFSIGSEFNSMQKDKSQWLFIVEAVRKEYWGAVTYSANWDSLESVSFIEALDLIGMTTYFSLTDKTDPTVKELTAGWSTVREDLYEWCASSPIPLFFTEVGFPSQDGANTNPWNYYLSEDPDLEEQRDCFIAFSEVWQETNWIRGVFFYNWFDIGGAEDTGYTPRGKPALEVIKQWFQTRH